jgi:hypothetical protein
MENDARGIDDRSQAALLEGTQVFPREARQLAQGGRGVACLDPGARFRQYGAGGGASGLRRGSKLSAHQIDKLIHSRQGAETFTSGVGPSGR